MPSVCLAHWREEEGRERARFLEQLGFSIRYDPVDAGALLAALKSDPPAALVIDLSRSPAQGRDLAVALRIHGATRKLPLIFVGGVPEKVDRVKEVLPDASYTGWEEIAGCLREAMANPLSDPVVPQSALAGYSGTPLPKKLGIKPGTRVLLVGAPEEFPKTLGRLPEGVALRKRFGDGVDLILWFVRSRRQLEKGIGTWASRVGRGGIWILWPKKSSGVPSDLSQVAVRSVGLDSGLVDFKIAAVDETWSGLKFAVRKKP
ncbi:MAG: hypothetical protein ACWGSQ_04450 [Longimicrobiales bacterium]